MMLKIKKPLTNTNKVLQGLESSFHFEIDILAVVLILKHPSLET